MEQEIEEKPKKRIHFKDRGKTIKPVCPYCQGDLQVSYIRKRIEGKLKLVKTEWQCVV